MENTKKIKLWATLLFIVLLIGGGTVFLIGKKSDLQKGQFREFGTEFEIPQVNIPLSPVAIPTITPNGGSFTRDKVEVTLATSTPGASIRFTTRGEEPTAASGLYTEFIVLNNTTTIKAKAFKEGVESGIASATFCFGQIVQAGCAGFDTAQISPTAGGSVIQDNSGLQPRSSGTTGGTSDGTLIRDQGLTTTPRSASPSQPPTPQAGSPRVGAGLLDQTRLGPLPTNLRLPPQVTVSVSPDTPRPQTKSPSDAPFFTTILKFTATGRIEIGKLVIETKENLTNTLNPDKIEKIEVFTKKEDQMTQVLEANFDPIGTIVNFGEVPWIIDERNPQYLLIKAKLKPTAESGKSFALGIKNSNSLSILGIGSVQDIAFPAMGNVVTVRSTQPTPAQPTTPAAQPTQPQAPSTPASPTPSSPSQTAIPPASVTQTCEQRGKHTYTGPEKPGVRIPGMCIDCQTETYLRNGGTCLTPATPIAQAEQIQPAIQAQVTPKQEIAQQIVTIPQRSAAYVPTPSLQRSQRLVRAPEKANTGPEIWIYPALVALVHAGMWTRRKLKK